ncbi:sensor histidine kinase [Nocardiopsis sp. JB363]|uniref:sensor histidine kinase n=1 Tax=Nocardiopsis sp. JB363 TaxID=1434837 RepID=UPI00097A4EED|nr:histidine kinase [Nocardiopsis sp. JB363]SIO87139.1 putative two-component system sensor kinase [Nocardiopsis sp. JB363]
MPEQTEATPRQLRRLNVSVVTAALSATGALLVITDTEVWWQALLLAAGLATALFTVNWSATDQRLRVLVPGLVVTAVVWTVGVLVAGTLSASFGLAIVGTLFVQRLTRHRRAAALTLVAFGVVVLAAMPLTLGLSPLELLTHTVATVCVAVTASVLTSLIQVVSTLVDELERSRQREADLAVARERVRFAGDLHDIQGHTLHVVKLKVTLARKLLDRDQGEDDRERADRELGEVHELVGDTIARTKELAHAQRRLNLSAELENAGNLFEAAGIRVSIERRGEVDSRVGEMLGQVLRETTTNILRHAQAERVRITLAERGITIANDGVRQGPATELRGLATLRERVGDLGGELVVERSGGDFLTAATFSAPNTDLTGVRGTVSDTTT